MTAKEFTDSWESSRRAFGLAVAAATLLVAALGAYHASAVQPVAERVDRVEVRQTQSERDRAEELQRLRGIEVRLDGTLRILRRLEKR